MTEIKFITCNDSEYETVKSIRTCVFTVEQGADGESEFDRYDNSSLFALLYRDKKAVGTARVVLTEKGYKIGRIAILKEYRGQGLGADIVKAVCEKAFEKGAETVYVDAQNYAVPFYQKLGFKVIGAEITDRGLPHIPMMLKGENNG